MPLSRGAPMGDSVGTSVSPKGLPRGHQGCDRVQPAPRAGSTGSSLLSSSQAVLTQPQSTESLLCARHVCSPFMASYIRGPLESMAIVQVGTLRHTETRSKWASIRICLRKMDRGRPTQEGAGESGQ